MLLLAFALILNVHTTSAATTNGTSSINSSVSSNVNNQVSAASSMSATLKSNSVSTSKDVTKPKVVKTDPKKNAVKVDTKKTIKIYFSEAIKFGNAWIELKNNKKNVSIKTSINGKILTIDPRANLSKDGKYNLCLHTGSITDMSGNKLNVYTSSFSTVSSKKPVPSALKKYLVPTSHCQSTNPKIKALAAKLTKGSTSDYAKASKIFNWVRNHVSYSFYYNTRKGAVGTLNSRSANCADTAHLVVALERAAGIPARYNHGTCRFSSGTWYGHVWAQVYVNGKWYYADGTSHRNSFGVVKNWNTKTFKLHGIYASLPF
jgi:methionine-rich copper-binding protein CopC